MTNDALKEDYANPSIDEVLNALSSDNDSEYITWFKLSYPKYVLRNRKFLVSHWNVIRMHVPISKLTITSNTQVSVTMPDWLGGACYVCNFWEPREDNIVTDCIQMKTKYDLLKSVLQSN